MTETCFFRWWYDAHTQQVSSLVQLEAKDIFDTSLAGSSVIIVYLFREASGKLPAANVKIPICLLWLQRAHRQNTGIGST